MKIRVTWDQMVCVSLLRWACFHNGHSHRELWSVGLREILGPAIRHGMGPEVEFEVVQDFQAPPIH